MRQLVVLHSTGIFGLQPMGNLNILFFSNKRTDSATIIQELDILFYKTIFKLHSLGRNVRTYIYTLLMICLLSYLGVIQMTGSGGMSKVFGVFEHPLLIQRRFYKEKSTNMYHCVETWLEGMHIIHFWDTMWWDLARPVPYSSLPPCDILLPRDGQNFITDDVLWSTFGQLRLWILKIIIITISMASCKIKRLVEMTVLVLIVYFEKYGSGFPILGKRQSCF